MVVCLISENLFLLMRQYKNLKLCVVLEINNYFCGGKRSDLKA